MRDLILKNSVGRLRWIAMLEGVSFVLLLFVAMPMKYLGGMDVAVKVTGMAHGVLFLMFCAALVPAHFRARWSWMTTGLIFLASLVPFGPLLIDRKLKAAAER